MFSEFIEKIFPRKHKDLDELSLTQLDQLAYGHIFAFMHGGSNPMLQGDALQYLARVEGIPILEYRADEIMTNHHVAQILVQALKKMHPGRASSDDLASSLLSDEISKGLRNAIDGKPIDLSGIKNRTDFQNKYPKGHGFLVS